MFSLLDKQHNVAVRQNRKEYNKKYLPFVVKCFVIASTIFMLILHVMLPVTKQTQKNCFCKDGFEISPNQ